jgi:hypothetical protein
VLPDGAAAECGECYAVALSAPVVRPRDHWDASFLETLLPEAVRGQRRTWRLHVGDSFTDVPRNTPFYAFVETLLHHGVTAGCAPRRYCAEGAATRDQMAAFVLGAARPGVAPPPCVAGRELFGDVPASSAFCAWIEDLARRGVVAGCQAAPALYCPAQAVTRAEMAVYVLAAAQPGVTPPGCTAGAERFADVPAGSPFCPWVEELARRGVVSGCGAAPPVYCPADAVTRAQMAVFIAGTFGLALYGP